MILAKDTSDSAVVVRQGDYVFKRVDRRAWQKTWDMSLDAQMAAREIESRRWPSVARLFWYPRHDVLVHRWIEGRRATLEESRGYIERCALDGRLAYLRDVRSGNLVSDRDGRLWLIDFWIDLARFPWDAPALALTTTGSTP